MEKEKWLYSIRLNSQFSEFSQNSVRHTHTESRKAHWENHTAHLMEVLGVPEIWQFGTWGRFLQVSQETSGCIGWHRLHCRVWVTWHGPSRLILRRTAPPSPAAAKAQPTAILGEQQDSSQSLLLLVLISTDLTSLLLSVQNVEINPTPPQGIQAHPRGSVPWWGISKSQPSHCNCSQRNTGQYSQFLEHMARQSTFEIPRTLTQDLPKCFRNCIWVLDVHQSTHLPDRPWPV